MRDNNLCLVLQKLLSLAKHNYGTNKVRPNKYLVNFDIRVSCILKRNANQSFSNAIKYLFRYMIIHQEVAKQ